jgi:hypothetical protein
LRHWIWMAMYEVKALERSASNPCEHAVEFLSQDSPKDANDSLVQVGVAQRGRWDPKVARVHDELREQGLALTAVSVSSPG